MGRVPREEGFSRRHRFAARGSFTPMLRRPKKKGALAAIQTVAGVPGTSRLGIALTRRLVPSALERNRVKRIVRDVFRRHPIKRRGLDCVVTLRERFERSASASLREEIARLFDEACTKGDA